MEVDIRTAYEDLQKIAKDLGKEEVFNKAMEVCKPYGLHYEVCWSALHDLEATDYRDLENSLEYGLSEWIK